MYLKGKNHESGDRVVLVDSQPYIDPCKTFTSTIKVGTHLDIRKNGWVCLMSNGIRESLALPAAGLWFPTFVFSFSYLRDC